MVEINRQVASMMQLQQRLEGELRLPVVVSQSGKAYVLDKFCKQVDVLESGTVTPAFSPGKTPAASRGLSIKLFWRYPEVPVSAAKEVLGRIKAGTTKLRNIHIIIDTGPAVADWAGLQRITSAILDIQSKSKIPTRITIDGAFECPDEHYVDWLTKQRIVARYILGPALGYAGDIDNKAAKTLEAMSGYGLRVPLLFYWSGEAYEGVANVLKKALRLNKLAGVGVLPYFLSPRFDCRTMGASTDLKGFSKVVGFLYADRLLSEYLEEPVSDIESRLAVSPNAKSVRVLITEKGGLLQFRRFPFAAAGKNTPVPLYGRCRRCAWRQICGGVDVSPTGFSKQFKIAADAWCEYRKTFMRRIVGECLEIREHIHRIKGGLLKGVKV
jgi:hypothetical protein